MTIAAAPATMRGLTKADCGVIPGGVCRRRTPAKRENWSSHHQLRGHRVGVACGQLDVVTIKEGTRGWNALAPGAG